ncbi:hypothetical protein OG302_42770 [Streptomyces sp. NBC_01283]|nr:hypothetical protein OG302_42770 [Streptomyces sp. NBC_01283]
MGVDLGKRFLLACVRVPATQQAGRWPLKTERHHHADVRHLLAGLL